MFCTNWKILLTIIQTIITVQGQSNDIHTVSTKFDSPCGIFHHNKETDNFVHSYDSITRIINGEKAQKAIPWMAHLTMKFFICTGVIISQWHIMTAAHCVFPFESGKPIKPKDISVHIGGTRLNHMRRLKVSHIDVPNNTKLVRLIADGADIAILTMEQPIEFDKQVFPICLPSADTLEFPVLGYAAGWGARYSWGTKSHSCQTNEIGPQKFTPCKGGKTSCLKFVNPPNVDPKCPMYWDEAMKQMPEDHKKVVLERGSRLELTGDIQKTCYGPINYGKYGWCFTSSKEDGWGYCSRSCSYEFKQSKDLEYVSLKAFNPADCTYEKTEVVPGPPGSTLCIGGVPPVTKIASFDVENQLYKFTGYRNDSVQPEMTGYTDTCFGDSGGPFWKFVKPDNAKVQPGSTMYAVLLGITSAGPAVCGRMNSLAIYTRVTRHMDWVIRVTNNLEGQDLVEVSNKGFLADIFGHKSNSNSMQLIQPVLFITTITIIQLLFLQY